MNVRNTYFLFLPFVWLFAGCTLFFDTDLPDFTCCGELCSPEEGDSSDCDEDARADAGDVTNDVVDSETDTINWPGDVTDVPDGGTDAPDGGRDTLLDGPTDTSRDVPPNDTDTSEEDVRDWEVDTSETPHYYVVNYHPRDRDRVAHLNLGVRPEVEVLVDGTGWVMLAHTNEAFSASGLAGSAWRINIPNPIGSVGCTEYYLPVCLEDVCEVQVPPHSTSDLVSMSITEGGVTRGVSTEYLCIHDLVDELPAAPEIFCPNTSTVIRISNEPGVGDLFCVEPLYLEDVSNEVLTQCRNQDSGESFYEECGILARSYVMSFPTWRLEQTIRVGDNDISRGFDFQR